MRHQSIIWTSTGLLLLAIPRTNFNEFLFKTYRFPYRKVKIVLCEKAALVSRPQYENCPQGSSLSRRQPVNVPSGHVMMAYHRWQAAKTIHFQWCFDILWRISSYNVTCIRKQGYLMHNIIHWHRLSLRIDFTPYFIMDVISYPRCDSGTCLLVKGLSLDKSVFFLLVWTPCMTW